MYQIDEEIIGRNAGEIWHTLNDKGSLSKHQVISNTDLSENDFYEGVGWLACENKIRKDGEFYKLEQTNLSDIGINADLLLEVLKEMQYSVSDLFKVTKMSEEEIHQAIGWLSRKGKLRTTHDDFNTDYFSEQEEKIQVMQDEINDLKEDLSDRNQLIQSLTSQINDVQMNVIKDSDVIDQLSMQISGNHNLVSDKIKLLSESQSQINLLKSEVNTIQEDLDLRNMIINELSRQLTDSQSELLNKTDAFDSLQESINKMQNFNNGSKTDLQQRLETVSSLQDKIEHMTNQINSTNPTELFEENSPALEIQKKEVIDSNVIDSSFKQADEQMEDSTVKKNANSLKSMDCNELD